MEKNDSFYLSQMELGPMENFVYLIGDKATREVFVVDPAWQVDTVLKKAKEEDLKIVGALVSHYHFDHTNGIEELLRRASLVPDDGGRRVPCRYRVDAGEERRMQNGFAVRAIDLLLGVGDHDTVRFGREGHVCRSGHRRAAHSQF